jgi:vitamin B12 transporter
MLNEKAVFAAGLRFNAPSNSDSSVVWDLTGRYDFNDRFFARGNIGTAFRYPDAYELFANDPDCPCFGNPNLKPETSTNFNASVGTRLNAGSRPITLEAITFFRTVSDLITDVEIDPDSGATQAQNVDDEVRVRGFTLSALADFGSPLSGSFGYTYTSSQNKTEIAGGYQTLPGIPNNQFVMSLDYHPGDLPVGAMFTVNFVGEFFDTVTGFGSVEGGNYAVVDLAGRIFLDAQRRHRVNLRLENLFDQTYTTVHVRGFTDDTASPYVVNTLGTPATLHLSYSYSF